MASKFQLIDRNHPMYRPLWVRMLIVAITGTWTVFEFLYGSPFWGTIVAGITLLATFEFFIKKPDPLPKEQSGQSDQAEKPSDEAE